MIDLINKEVIHQTFGRGNVVKYDESYIKISFESGNKRFIFPDIFRKHIEFIDQGATNSVRKKIEKKREEIKARELIIKEEEALEQERQYILSQSNLIKSGKTHSKIQSVFWCEEKEEDSVFEDWSVFTGEIKSGDKKGQPRKLVRMDKNSACLLTKREDDTPEKDRQILGVFMTNDFFNGRLCEDGYITAHPKYRLQLSEEESEKMLFWNYYFDIKDSKGTVWNSGRQRYFDNIFMAQILRDIVYLREDPQERKYANDFFEYFCKSNIINKNELSNANGALLQS